MGRLRSMSPSMFSDVAQRPLSPNESKFSVVHKGPRPLRLSPNEQAVWARNEGERKRRERLQQVRDQERVKAEQRRAKWHENEERKLQEALTEQKLLALVKAKERLKELLEFQQKVVDGGISDFIKEKWNSSKSRWWYFGFH